MTNRWVEFVKEYSKKNNISYTCAMCEIKTKGLYKPLDKQETRGEKKEKEKEEKIEELVFKNLQKEKEEIIKEMEEIQKKPKKKGELTKANREEIFGLKIQLDRNQQSISFFKNCIERLTEYREKLKQIEEHLEERKRNKIPVERDYLIQLKNKGMFYINMINKCEKALTKGSFDYV